MRTHARIETGRYIPHRIAAAALGGQPGFGQRAQRGNDGIQRHAMHLKFLASGDMKHAVAERRGDFPQAPQRAGQHASCWSADAQHVSA